MENSAQSLYGLIFGCPLEDENLKNKCPLNRVWASKPIERIDFVKSLTVDEIKELEKFHNCAECKRKDPERISERLQKKINSL